MTVRIVYANGRTETCIGITKIIYVGNRINNERTTITFISNNNPVEFSEKSANIVEFEAFLIE